MPDFSQLHKRARHDIRMCLQSWSEVLQAFLGDRIECVYSKGSSSKKWDSPIDYVPVLSDVDIHIHLKDDEGLLAGSDDPFDAAMHLSKGFEERFFQLEPEPLHLPRSQLVILNKSGIFVRDNRLAERFVPPVIEHVNPVIGVPVQMTLPPADNVRLWDLDSLLEIEDFLRTVPLSAIDRAGFDFWSLIRRMTYRISPSPVRLLTQDNDDPYDVWSWNRTKISSELRGKYPGIEKHYRGFYEAGWRLFLSNFSSRDAFREVTKHGYYVLKECHEKAVALANSGESDCH